MGIRAGRLLNFLGNVSPHLLEASSQEALCKTFKSLQAPELYSPLQPFALHAIFEQVASTELPEHPLAGVAHCSVGVGLLSVAFTANGNKMMMKSVAIIFIVFSAV